MARQKGYLEVNATSSKYEKFYHHLSGRGLYLPLISVFLSVGDTEDFSGIWFCVVFPELADPHTN